MQLEYLFTRISAKIKRNQCNANRYHLTIFRAKFIKIMYMQLLFITELIQVSHTFVNCVKALRPSRRTGVFQIPMGRDQSQMPWPIMADA